MAAMATLNVRLPLALKERGMQVLDREGVSVSAAVRRLFLEMERTQKLPDFIAEEGRLAEIQQKRVRLRMLVAMTPSSPPGDGAERDSSQESYREAYRKHLEEKHRPGVRA